MMTYTVNPGWGELVDASGSALCNYSSCRSRAPHAAKFISRDGLTTTVCFTLAAQAGAVKLRYSPSAAKVADGRPYTVNPRWVEMAGYCNYCVGWRGKRSSHAAQFISRDGFLAVCRPYAVQAGAVWPVTAEEEGTSAPLAELPDGEPSGGQRTWAELARNTVARSAREGRLTRTEVLDHAASAVIAAPTQALLKSRLAELLRLVSDWADLAGVRIERRRPSGLDEILTGPYQDLVAAKERIDVVVQDRAAEDRVVLHMLNRGSTLPNDFLAYMKLSHAKLVSATPSFRQADELFSRMPLAFTTNRRLAQTLMAQLGGMGFRCSIEDLP